MDDSFNLTEFVPLGLTLERIGPFQDRQEFFDFRDAPRKDYLGQPSNYYLLLSGNGRGKTHILEVMAALMGVLGQRPGTQRQPNPFGFEPLDKGEGRAQLDFRISYVNLGVSHTEVFSIFGGRADDEVWFKSWTEEMLFEVDATAWRHLGVIRRGTNEYKWVGHQNEWVRDFAEWIADMVGENVERFGGGSSLTAPTLIYFPAYRDIAALPETERRAIEPPQDWNYRPVHIFRQSGNQWRQSLDNLLVWLMWLDDGRYQAALDLVNNYVLAKTGKELIGISNRNELVAKIQCGEKNRWHRLDQLSSGEKSLIQIFLLLGAHMTKNTILLIDEVDAHLHPRLRAGIAHRLKSMIANEPGLSVFLATHADEVIDSLSMEVLEPGLRKSAYLLESPEEEKERERIIQEAKFMQQSLEG